MSTGGPSCLIAEDSISSDHDGRDSGRLKSSSTGRSSRAISHDQTAHDMLNGLELLLTVDTRLTRLLAFCSNPSTRYLKLLQRICLTLEVSGHGVPWFVITGLLLTGSLLLKQQFFWVYGFDLLAILILDIVLVAPLKLVFKRPRPPVNNGSVILTVSAVDSYAFPSGHASRAVAIAAFFCYMPPFNVWTHLWYIWAAVVSISRIMLGRHHVLDVFAGAIAGLAVFEIIHQTCLLTVT